MHCRAVRRGRARQRLAPTRWDDSSPIGHMGATVGRWPRFVGVRRCLTRRPGRAGNDTADARRRSVAIIAACRDATRTCRAYRRGRARQRLAPTRWANPPPIGRRCITGWCQHARPVVVRRCLPRPARQGRESRCDGQPGWHGAHRLRIGTGGSRAVRRGRARQRLAPTTWRGPSPVGHIGITVMHHPAL
jgi:hypothetical protein